MKERAEPKQAVQAPEVPGEVRLDSRQMRRNVSVGQFLSRALQTRVRRMAYISSPDMSGEPSWMRKVEGRKLVEVILKAQRSQGLRQTSVAILNIDTDVTNGLKWRLCKAAQQSQIPLVFVCDDGIVTARNELVQKCLCLEVRHEPQNVEQALRRMTHRNGLNMLEACLSIAIACGHDVRKAINTAQSLGQRSSSNKLPTVALSASAACQQLLLPSDATDVPDVLGLLEQDGEELCRALQRLYLTSFGESFETLDQCAFAALIVTLNAEKGLPKGRIGQPLDRSQSRGAQDGGLLVTNSVRPNL